MRTAAFFLLGIVTSLLSGISSATAVPDRRPEAGWTVKDVPAFPVVEATIAGIHEAFRTGRLSARALVGSYLRRIDAYDQTSGLNAIVVVNPEALSDGRRPRRGIQENGQASAPSRDPPDHQGQL